jgi:cyanate permease
MMISSLAQSISVPAMGAVYDFTGSYVPAWVLFIACSVIITGCLIGVEFLSRGGHTK